METRIGRDTLVLHLPGEWDISHARDLRALLVEAREMPDVVLDMTETTFFDSTAIRQLAEVGLHRTKKRGFPVATIVVPHGKIDRQLRVADFDAYFRIVRSMREA